MNVYDFTVKDLSGKTVPMKEFAGNVLLIVNIASGCGQAPQLSALETLYQQYKSKGFFVIGFPSNQFKQEPLQGKEISQLCSEYYGVTFPIMEKIQVRGKETHPLFNFFADKKQNGKFSSRPYWNYYKYLIDRNGNAVDYFFTYRKPLSGKITEMIEEELT